MNNTTAEALLLQKDTIWFGVFISEFIVVFCLNAFTLIVFARNRHLCKRTTYLIINLTVADFLVGAVSGPLDTYFVSTINVERAERKIVIITFRNIFLLSSLSSLSLISLERLHATVYPFRHCLISGWTYFKVIIVSWLMALLLSLILAVLIIIHLAEQTVYIWASYIVLTLLIVTVSYVIIIVKVKTKPPPQHSRTIASDRKLSSTLFIVTAVSLLFILPWGICVAIPPEIWSRLSPRTVYDINTATILLFHTSSMVNPLIYVVRMHEFRRAVKGLIPHNNQD